MRSSRYEASPPMRGRCVRDPGQPAVHRNIPSREGQTLRSRYQTAERLVHPILRGTDEAKFANAARHCETSIPTNGRRCGIGCSDCAVCGIPSKEGQTLLYQMKLQQNMINPLPRGEN